MDMWKCHTPDKQLPIPDEDSQIFWEGCRRRRLLIQQCDGCKTFRFPPGPICPHCLCGLATWQDDPGCGKVVTYCVYYSELAGSAWRGDLPYVVVVVHLSYSDTHMLSNLVCDGPDRVRIGLPVRVTFEPASASMTLPKFVPCEVPDSPAMG
ncbi:hypothetical protein NKDENANG_00449 [Candidatus Entotheonellaceae bacterium PAL068K]